MKKWFNVIRIVRLLNLGNLPHKWVSSLFIIAVEYSTSKARHGQSNLLSFMKNECQKIV